MSGIARGSGASWGVSANSFDIETNSFAEERDTARAMFYMKDEIGPTGELIQVEMVEIRGPGENLCVFGGKVRDIDRKRFKDTYEAFKRGETITTGTPLSKWDAVSNLPQFMNELRARGYFTVEDLAGMPDGALHEFHGSLTWRKKAQDYLTKQAKVAKVEESEATKTKLAEMEAQLAELTAKLAAQPKRRGPKPKTSVIAA